MTVAIVHPRLPLKLLGFFPALVTIQAKTIALDVYGQETETWADVSGWQSIKCAKAPLSASERQAAQFTVTDRAWSVLLAGSYPTITTRHRAVINVEMFDIDAVEVDQVGVLTRLRIRAIGV